LFAIVAFAALSTATSVASLPPPLKWANFYFTGSVQGESSTVTMKGRFELSQASDGGILSRITEAVSIMSNATYLGDTYTVLNDTGLYEYNVDSAGCYVESTTMSDPSFPVCNEWVKLGIDMRGNSVWSQTCNQELDAGTMMEALRVAVSPSVQVVRITSTSTSTMGNSSATTQLDWTVTRWVNEAPDASDIAPPDAAECETDTMKGAIAKRSSSAAKRCWGCCYPCKAAILLPMAGIQVGGTVACNKYAFDALCSKIPFVGGPCRDLFGYLCDQCRRNNRGQCNNEWVAHELCRRSGKC